MSGQLQAVAAAPAAEAPAHPVWALLLPGTAGMRGAAPAAPTLIITVVSGELPAATAAWTMLEHPLPVWVLLLPGMVSLRDAAPVAPGHRVKAVQRGPHAAAAALALTAPALRVTLCQSLHLKTASSRLKGMPQASPASSQLPFTWSCMMLQTLLASSAPMAPACLHCQKDAAELQVRQH